MSATRCARCSPAAATPQRVAVPAGQLLPVPRGMPLIEAAGLPEVMSTVWSNVFMLAALRPHETLLVHGGTSGIGTTAIQLAKSIGATVIATCGTDEKCARARELGADVAVNYREQDFVAEVAAATGARGADVILDNMGAKYLARNVEALAPNGRLVVIGLQGGTKAELNLNQLLQKRAAVLATSLRAAPGRGEGLDRRLGPRARLAAHREGRRARSSSTAPCRSPRSPTPTA